MEENKKIIIKIDDSEYSTCSIPTYERKEKWEMPDDRNIKAIIPGTIVDIYVKEGSKVKKGDNMLVIQAMKMNNQILFNRDGIVDKILVSSGSIISKGQTLVVLK